MFSHFISNCGKGCFNRMLKLLLLFLVCLITLHRCEEMSREKRQFPRQQEVDEDSEEESRNAMVSGTG